MNASELSRLMSDNAAQVAHHLFPNGRKASGEWRVGGLHGAEGSSLSVRIGGAKKGVWCDFATGEKGDLIDLWAAVRGQSLAEAMSDIKQYFNVRDEVNRPPPKKFTPPDRSLFKRASTAVIDWLRGRGITEETVAAFKVAQTVREDKTYAVFPYLKDGALINTKARNISDKRDMRQSAGAQPCLFGWHLVSEKARTVVICEGEIDAMTLWQVGIPALSVNAGAGNHQWIESDWDRLEVFSTIYLCYDNDDAGRKGAAEVAQRLGNDRCRLVVLGAKDANEWLLQGAKAEQFVAAVSAAKTMDPEELRSISDFMGDVKSLFYPDHSQHSSLPLLRLGSLQCDWFEFRPGELTVWTGFNGHGKSLMLNQVLLGLIEQGDKVCVFSGEMVPAYQGKRLVKQAAGLDRPTPDYIDAIGGWVQDKMWLFNVTGSASISRLTEVFGYGAKRYGITHFVVDSLMMTDVPEDGPSAFSKQKEAIQSLSSFAKANRAHVHLVAHPRKARDEGDMPGKMDVAGSSKITDGADNVFTVWSARREADDPDQDKPDACLELHKQRNGDIQHKKQWLWFDKGSMQYTPDKRRRPHCYVRFSIENIRTTYDDILPD